MKGSTVEANLALSAAVMEVRGITARPDRFELGPSAPEPVSESASVRNPTGSPTFIPVITRPEIVNWGEVHERIGVGVTTDGEVLIWGRLDEAGNVVEARTFASSGNQQVDQLVESAVRDVARFRPAVNRSQGVPVWVQIPFTLARS